MIEGDNVVAHRKRLLAAALCLFLPVLFAVPAQAGARVAAPPPSDAVIAKWGTFYFKNGQSISEQVWSRDTEE